MIEEKVNEVRKQGFSEYPNMDKTRKRIIKKSRRGLRTLRDVVPLKEPVVILMRRSSEIEVYEGEKKRNFDYKHSDGDERHIILNPKYIYNFKYGRGNFKAYVCHEDHPFPLPEDPIISTDMLHTTLNKVLHDEREWEVKEKKERTKLVKTVLGGLAILAVIAVLYFAVLKPDVGATIIREVARNTTTIAQILQNVTPN